MKQNWKRSDLGGSVDFWTTEQEQDRVTLLAMNFGVEPLLTHFVKPNKQKVCGINQKLYITSF